MKKVPTMNGRSLKALRNDHKYVVLSFKFGACLKSTVGQRPKALEAEQLARDRE